MRISDEKSRCLSNVGLWSFRAKVILLCAVATVHGTRISRAQDESAGTEELLVRWEYVSNVEQPSSDQSKLTDVILDLSVFSHARVDLADLRLVTDRDQTVPYALRVLRPESRREPFEADEFNRSVGSDNSSELSLDLKRDDIQHNELEVITPGNNFRRKIEVEGSSDTKSWSILASTHLIRFQRDAERIEGNTVTYPPSRFRYLKVRVSPDAAVDNGSVRIEGVKVVRRVEVAGEMLTLDGQLGARQPVRADGGPGSAWVIDLGGDNVPCESIEVDVSDVQLARNFYIEEAGPVESDQRFRRVSLIGSGFWQRRAGEVIEPLVAKFSEVRASRLKLVVTDHRNPPLNIQSVKFSAPARQVVFATPASSDSSLKLYYGNPQAEAPNYDFARNLPAQLESPPTRSTLEAGQRNPSFDPPPQPFTERWPWVIYVVLGSVSIVLAWIILGLARAAIAVNDREMNNA